MADRPSTSPPTVASQAPPAGDSRHDPGLQQCSITGKWCAGDELIMFQGQLVSAEGKQILLDRLRTGVNAPGEYVRPTVLRRFGCLFVDGLVLMFAWFMIEMIVTTMMAPQLLPTKAGTKMTAVDVETFAFESLSIIYLMIMVIEVSYFAILHGWTGQTIGKLVGHLRVVNLDGSRISWKKALARAVVYLGGMILFPLGFLIFFVATAVTALAYIGMIQCIAVAWILADIICALVDTRAQRSLHDRICATRVIYEG